MDVARAAGVSRQTVTRAVNDMPGINPVTRERVLAAVRELNYHPSRFGRGLVKPSARTLGLVVGDLTNPYYADLAATVLRLAAERGWNVVMAEPGSVADLVGAADAVVGFTGLALEPPGAGAPNLPVVEIDPPASTRARAHRVRAPHRHTGRRAAPAGARNPAAGRARHGVPVLPRPDVPRGLRRGGSRRRRRRPRHPLAGTGPLDPDALVAFNDLDGFRLLRELEAHGTGVPGDVRVVGVDGLALGDFVTPRLSTLAIDLAEVGRAALDLVVELSGGPAANLTRVVPHRFVVRDST